MNQCQKEDNKYCSSEQHILSTQLKTPREGTQWQHALTFQTWTSRFIFQHSSNVKAGLNFKAVWCPSCKTLDTQDSSRAVMVSETKVLRLSMLCPSSDSSGVKLFAYRQQIHGFLFEPCLQALSMGPIATSAPNTHRPPKQGSWWGPRRWPYGPDWS